MSIKEIAIKQRVCDGCGKRMEADEPKASKDVFLYDARVRVTFVSLPGEDWCDRCQVKAFGAVARQVGAVKARGRAAQKARGLVSTTDTAPVPPSASNSANASPDTSGQPTPIEPGAVVGGEPEATGPTPVKTQGQGGRRGKGMRQPREAGRRRKDYRQPQGKGVEGGAVAATAPASDRVRIISGPGKGLIGVRESHPAETEGDIAVNVGGRIVFALETDIEPLVAP